MAQFTQSTDESKDILTNLVPLFSDVEMSITFGSLCKQLDKGQDLAVHGKYDKGYYVGVFDGHGMDDCIKILRGLDYSIIANDPLRIIEHTSSWLYNSGSTMNFTTIQVEDEIIITNYNFFIKYFKNHSEA
jgi:hypothetical protein